MYNRIGDFMKKILLMILLSFSLVGCGASKRSMYTEANQRIQAGDYDEGYKILLSLKDYKDSHEIVVNSLSQRIDAFMKAKNIEEAKDLLDELCGIDSIEKYNDLLEKINIFDSLSEVEIGDTIQFGNYLQDGEEKEPIEWIVLAQDEDKILVTSKNILEVSSYHSEQRTVTWQGCALRKYLNEDFYKNAFSKLEREFIETVENVTIGSVPTEDQVFCLSVSEVEKYFLTDESRKAVSTQYAKDKGVYVYAKNGGTYYWLRDQGNIIEKAAYVFASGEITQTSKEGLLVYTENTDGGVRPAMWVNTNIFDLPHEEEDETKFQS